MTEKKNLKGDNNSDRDKKNFSENKKEISKISSQRTAGQKNNRENVDGSEISNLNDHQWIRFRGKTQEITEGDIEGSWANALEEVVQNSIRMLHEQQKKNYYISGLRDLESTLFSVSLIEVAKNWKKMGVRLPPQLTLFSELTGLVSFQVHERRYICVNYTDLSSENYISVVNDLAGAYSSRTTDLKDIPTTEELLTHLLDHLHEDLRKKTLSHEKIPQIKHEENKETSDEKGEYIFADVHPARRSAIKNWQKRVEFKYFQKYNHEEEDYKFYSYPVIDLISPDARNLIMILVSPLDLNFVDEKVTLDNRCAEITLALFNLEKSYHPGRLSELANQLKQTFGRVLFTNMHEEASIALTTAFDAQSIILRSWVSQAAKGYSGLINEKNFDGMGFCEAVVENVLCADITGIDDTEIYPFDRVYILKEAGVSSNQNLQKPIEVKVLEAATLSINPGDRGQYLTRMEREIRGTEDYDCDASKKRIKSENSFTFYIHGCDAGLVFSRRKTLSEKEKNESFREIGSSKSTQNLENRLFPIWVPDEDESENDLSDIIENLFGRLLPDNFMEKEHRDPYEINNILFKTRTFKEDFEQRRLEVTERFDENGLLFFYEHGINLSQNIPLLARIQTVYQNYLERLFENRDRQHLREKLLAENLSPEQMEKFLKLDKKRKKTARRMGNGFNKQFSGKTIERRATKVVYISFSYLLHDENMRMLRKQQGALGDDSKKANSLLDDEYTYTMILVSDHDPEKSLAQLNAERENLKLFFQLIMNRIWMDNKKEISVLEKKSRVISNGLEQFVHDVRYLIEDPADRERFDELNDNFSQIILPDVEIKDDLIEDEVSFFRKLLDIPIADEDYLNAALDGIHARVIRWFKDSNTPNNIQIRILPSNLPKFKLNWSRAIVIQAFDNIIKNAIEAAAGDIENTKEPFIEIQLTTIPRITNHPENKQMFLDIVVTNSGGPIPASTLSILNNPDPSIVGKTLSKKGWGVGVYINRYQLQTNIGRGADLIFSNLSHGVVQTRLRLPAYEIEESIKSKEAHFSETSELDEHDYILYIEDAEKIYSKVVKEVDKFLNEKNVRCKHVKGGKTAMDYIHKKLPLAIITDLKIPEGELTGEVSQERFGIEFINELMQFCDQKNIRPPIWVLTAASEKFLREDIGDATDFGYRFLPDKSTGKELSQEGRICIFSGQKYPHKINQFPQFLDEITNESGIPTEQVDTGFDFPPVYKEISKHLIIPLPSEEFKELESIYIDANQSDSENLVIVTKICDNLIGLSEGCFVWFTHPGLPAPKRKYRSSDNVNRPLWKHLWHKRLVFSLLVDKDLYLRLPLHFLYWSLTKNILVCEEQKSVEENVKNIWLNIHQESGGPLSLLRHDILNEWSEPNLVPYLREALELINKSEKKLGLTDDLSNKFNKSVTSVDKMNLVLEEILIDHEVSRNIRKGFGVSLQAIDGKLSGIVSIDPMQKISIDKHRRMLKHLMDYLGD